MLPRLTMLCVLICGAALAAAADPKPAKTTTVKVQVFEWGPGGEYLPLEGAALFVSRGKAGQIGNKANADKEITLTDAKGTATLEFEAGTPVSLVSYRGKGNKVPEVLALACPGGDTHVVSIGLIEIKDYEAFLKKNPGASSAHAKFARAFNATPPALRKTPEGKLILKEFIDGYKKTKPVSSIVVPGVGLKGPAGTKALLAAVAASEGVPVTALVDMAQSAGVRKLKDAGATVLGAVDATKGATAAVTKWYESKAAIDGISIDKQPGGEKEVEANLALANHIRAQAAKAKRPVPLILGNCGGDFAADLLDRDVNTATVCFRSDKIKSVFDVTLPEWVEMGYADRSAVLVGGVGDAVVREGITRRMLRGGVGYLCVSDRPFGQLPTTEGLKQLVGLVGGANRRPLGHSEFALPGLILEFTLPADAVASIPGPQLENRVAHVTFKGMETVRLQTGDANMLFAMQPEKDDAGVVVRQRLVMTKSKREDDPTNFQFATYAEKKPTALWVTSRFDGGRARKLDVHPFEYGGVPVSVELSP